MNPHEGQDHVAVPCVRLDDVIGTAPVGFMKVDVEGFELSTLQGAESILAQSRPVLYIENDRLEKSEDLIKLLWSREYRLWWHIPPLFNPDNFFGEKENLYPNIASFNMVCLPCEMKPPFDGLTEITDATSHPLR